jgi:predicted RNase H-like HicB family nuclease
MTVEVDLERLTPEEWARVHRYALVIEWSDEDQKFLASAPDLPGLVTHGRTRTEAAEMGEEAIAIWLYGEANPPSAAFTAMSYPVRPEANVRELVSVRRTE